VAVQVGVARPGGRSGAGQGIPRQGDAIVEDEATEASAIVLTTELRQALDIMQGKGSQILTRPGPDDTVEVGTRPRRS
jgi:hypothetical protein